MVVLSRCRLTHVWFFQEFSQNIELPIKIEQKNRIYNKLIWNSRTTRMNAEKCMKSLNFFLSDRLMWIPRLCLIRRSNVQWIMFCIVVLRFANENQRTKKSHFDLSWKVEIAVNTFVFNDCNEMKSLKMLTKRHNSTVTLVTAFFSLYVCVNSIEACSVMYVNACGTDKWNGIIRFFYVHFMLSGRYQCFFLSYFTSEMSPYSIIW